MQLPAASTTRGVTAVLLTSQYRSGTPGPRRVAAQAGKKDDSNPFSAFTRKAREGLPKTDAVPSAPKFAKPRKGGAMDEQESLLLNFWVNERSFKLLGALVFTLLFVFIVVIGPP